MSDSGNIDFGRKVAALIALEATEEEAIELLNQSEGNLDEAVKRLEQKELREATNGNEASSVTMEGNEHVNQTSNVANASEDVADSSAQSRPSSVARAGVRDDSLTTSDTEIPHERKIAAMIALEATEEEAIELLNECGGDLDAAVKRLELKKMAEAEEEVAEQDLATVNTMREPTNSMETSSTQVANSQGLSGAALSASTADAGATASTSSPDDEVPLTEQTTLTMANVSNPENTTQVDDSGTNPPASGRPMPPQSSVTPGAFRVFPFADAANNDDDTTLTPSTVEQEIIDVSDNSTVAVSAQIAPENEEQYNAIREQIRNRERELEQERERIRRSRESAAVAHAVVVVEEENTQSELESEIQKRKRKQRWCALLVGVVLLILVVSLSVTLTRDTSDPSKSSTPSPPSTPAPTPPSTLVEMLAGASIDGGEALQTPSTPQNSALNWLAGNANLTEYSDEKQIQRYSLATLYYSTSGESWTNNTNWLSDSDECSWYNNAEGDFCSRDGRVLELNLSSNSLKGSIPEDVALLSNSLVSLDLSSNALTGTIPPAIGRLTDLGVVHLTSNGLAGTIPSEMFLLTKLSVLAMGNNALTGSISPQIGLLRNLTTLELSINELENQVPTEIGLLVHLNDLSLIRNDLTGPIPTEIGLLTNLGTLGVGGNFLNGTIIPEVFLLTNLSGLFLWENELTGPIPTEIGLLTRLSAIELQFNFLTGTIPTEMDRLTDLNHLRLDRNQWTGEFTCAESVGLCLISCTDTSNGACRSVA